MIYLDTSVALAHLLAEDRQPPDSLWDEELVSSGLLQYEIWTTLNRRELGGRHAEAADSLLGRVAMIEMAPTVLERALGQFPGSRSLRTLDALHLASCSYLRDRGLPVVMASYDRRVLDTARAMDMVVFDL